ncbi:hypothetical protein LOTGIDRAFT_161677 [Lottia gigantea]|uniref:Uncharacterized protein n=1 Tax=Lottia gigantea TaxID=225164 RepID=V4AJ59_LOTGI|nr:hypothetical protein LOTGIDRAFT_161677 [Lottia gigantea]ESO93571.1 hypothetical protein LOTGIDRAFT_161677 [Lottia gigantea]
MVFSDVTLLTKISAFLVLSAVVLDIVSLATPHWENGTLFDSGLWEICKEALSVRSCSSIPEDVISDKFQTVRAFVIIGCILGLLTFLLLIMFIFKHTANRVKNVVILLAGLAGICTLIGFCVYTSLADSYGYSFILNVVAGALYFVVTIIMALDQRTC